MTRQSMTTVRAAARDLGAFRASGASRTSAEALRAVRRAAIAALAALLLALALPLGAMAAEATEGVYDAYQVFSCEVKDASTSTVSHVAWASDEARDATTSAIRATDPSYVGTTAQEAADFATAHAADGVEAGSFLHALAAALRSSGTTPTTLANGEAADVPTGWYLLLTNEDSLGEGGAATAPVYTLLTRGQSLDVTPKAAVPTVQKHVQEDSTGTFGKVADATVADDLYWRLEATVPAGLVGYAHYGVIFHDMPSAGLDTSRVASSLAVYWHAGATGADFDAVGTGDDVAAAAAGWHSIDDATLTMARDGSFSVATGDLIAPMAAAGEDLAQGAQVVAVYSAPLNDSCDVGPAQGNPNDVTLEYPRNPLDEGDHGVTERKRAVAYTWELELTKRDATSDKAIAGATLRVRDDRGRALDAQGAWATGDATVAMSADGTLTIRGVDSGTFQVEETAAPVDYEPLAGTHALTLAADFGDVPANADEELLSAIQVRLTLTAESPLRADGVDQVTGLAKASVLDSKTTRRTPVPVTGDPTTWGGVAALALGGLALAAAARRMRGHDGDVTAGEAGRDGGGPTS